LAWFGFGYGGWGRGRGRGGWMGPWPGRGPFSYLPPWQRYSVAVAVGGSLETRGYTRIDRLSYPITAIQQPHGY